MYQFLDKGFCELVVWNATNRNICLLDYVCVCYVLSHVWLFVSPWTVAFQASLSMGIFRQEDCSGMPFPPQGDLPNSEVKPMALTSALAGRFFPIVLTGKPLQDSTFVNFFSLLMLDSLYFYISFGYLSYQLIGRKMRMFHNNDDYGYNYYILST